MYVLGLLFVVLSRRVVQLSLDGRGVCADGDDGVTISKTIFEAYLQRNDEDSRSIPVHGQESMTFMQYTRALNPGPDGRDPVVHVWPFLPVPRLTSPDAIGGGSFSSADLAKLLKISGTTCACTRASRRRRSTPVYRMWTFMSFTLSCRRSSVGLTP